MTPHRILVAAALTVGLVVGVATPASAQTFYTLPSGDQWDLAQDALLVFEFPDPAAKDAACSSFTSDPSLMSAGCPGDDFPDATVLGSPDTVLLFYGETGAGSVSSTVPRAGQVWGALGNGLVTLDGTDYNDAGPLAAPASTLPPQGFTDAIADAVAALGTVNVALIGVAALALTTGLGWMWVKRIRSAV